MEKTEKGKEGRTSYFYYLGCFDPGNRAGCPNQFFTGRECSAMKKYFALLFTLLLLVSSAAAEGARKLPIDLSGGAPYKVKYSSDLEVYEDPTIRVERHRVPSKEFVCTYYYALITVADASQLRTLPADNKNFLSNTRVPVIKMAKRANAILAINGDFTAAFSGNKSNTYVLRQGEVIRDTVEPGLDLLLIDEDGDFHIVPREEDLEALDKTTADGKKVINAFQFGPALIRDGVPADDESLLDQSHSPTYAGPHQLNQRMVIAQVGPLQYLTVCCAHYGATLPTMRDIVLAIAPECRNAYVMDGGDSTQMVFLGVKINNVKEEGGADRKVTDIIYFASADFED